MKIFSISLSENSFKAKTAGLVPPDCVIHSVTVENSVCKAGLTFFQGRKLYRAEFYPEDLIVEQVNGEPILCLYMSKAPVIEAEGDFLCETGSKMLNFLTGTTLFKLENLNPFLKESMPGLFFRNNDCTLNLAAFLAALPESGYFSRLCQWLGLFLLRCGFHVRLFPQNNAFRLEIFFH